MATATDTQLEFDLGENEIETDVSVPENNKTEVFETSDPSGTEQNAASSNR